MQFNKSYCFDQVTKGICGEISRISLNLIILNQNLPLVSCYLKTMYVLDSVEKTKCNLALQNIITYDIIC